MQNNAGLPDTIKGRRVVSYDISDSSGTSMLIVVLDDGTRLFGNISFRRRGGLYLAEAHVENGEEIWTEVAVRLLRAKREFDLQVAATEAAQRQKREEERQAWLAEYAAKKPERDRDLRKWADALLRRSSASAPSV